MSNYNHLYLFLVYKKSGYSGENNGTKEGLDGGGALAIDPEGVFNLAKWLTDGFSGYAAKLKFRNHDGFYGIVIKALWPGVGYLEEIILLFEYIKKILKTGFRLIIYGFDIQ